MVKDYCKIRDNHLFLDLLFNGEKVLLSAIVYVNSGFLFFQKKRKLIITSEQIIDCSNEKNIIKTDEYGSTVLHGHCH